jgi:hypothetical protein
MCIGRDEREGTAVKVSHNPRIARQILKFSAKATV